MLEQHEMMVENTCQKAWQRSDANSNESNSVLWRIPLRAAGDLTEIDQVPKKYNSGIFQFGYFGHLQLRELKFCGHRGLSSRSCLYIKMISQQLENHL